MHSLRILAILGVLSWVSPALAMEHYVNNVQDSRGVGIGLTSVTVYNTGTLVKATIYSDNGVTTKTNPITADSSGRYDFYAANGAYDLVFSRTGYTFSNTRTARITLYDVNDGGGGSPAGGTNAVQTNVAGAFADSGLTASGGTITGNVVASSRLNTPHSGSLPGTCAVGDFYMNTAGTSGQRMYACESANTWVLQGDGGAGGGLTHPQVMARTSMGF